MDARLGSREQEIRSELISILENITQDWGLDLHSGIAGSTGLMGDLGFESIDIVMFIVAIETRFAQKGLPFETLLMRDERYVEELSVDDVTAFLVRELP